MINKYDIGHKVKLLGLQSRQVIAEHLRRVIALYYHPKQKPLVLFI